MCLILAMKFLCLISINCTRFHKCPNLMAGLDFNSIELKRVSTCFIIYASHVIVPGKHMILYSCSNKIATFITHLSFFIRKKKKKDNAMLNEMLGFELVQGFYYKRIQIIDYSKHKRTCVHFLGEKLKKIGYFWLIYLGN